MVSCLVLLAGFCFSGQQIDMHMSDFGLGYSVSVTAPTYKAEFGGTDVLAMHDFRNAPKACVEKTCVRYIKTCDEAGARCEYRITWPGLISDGGVVISATNREALQIAETEIQKIVYAEGGEAKIPLSRMTVVSDHGALRDCPGGVTAEQCNPA
jgi:hypothetical protein